MTYKFQYDLGKNKLLISPVTFLLIHSNHTCFLATFRICQERSYLVNFYYLFLVLKMIHLIYDYGSLPHCLSLHSKSFLSQAYLVLSCNHSLHLSKHSSYIFSFCFSPGTYYTLTCYMFITVLSSYID